VAAKKKPQGTPSSVGRTSGSGSPESLSSSDGRPVSKAEDRRSRRAEAVAQMKREQAARQRRSRLLAAGGVVVAVAIIAVAVITVGLGHKHKAAATTKASEAVVAGVTNVPAATFDKVGLGALKTFPSAVKGGTPLTADSVSSGFSVLVSVS
jgi:hypothetical protein